MAAGINGFALTLVFRFELRVCNVAWRGNFW